jgi:hypothetical protein
MAKKRNPDFIKLLSELKENDFPHCDFVGKAGNEDNLMYCNYPYNLTVSLDKEEDNVMLFRHNTINIITDNDTLKINGKAAKLVYKDKSIKDALLDYAKTGDKRKIVDVFIKLLVYRDYNDAINFLYKKGSLYKKGRRFDDQEMINEINESYNALRKELKNEAAKQRKENKEQLTR